MKSMPGKFLESCRLKIAPFATTRDDKMEGMFRVPFIRATGLVARDHAVVKSLSEVTQTVDGQINVDAVYFLNCLSTFGAGWDHVSISVDGERRDPTWMEMAQVKELFFEDDECVVQFHPPKALHVNFHPHVLHLWRPQKTAIPLPPGHLVGPVETNPEIIERNEVLTSLDEKRIRDYFASKGIVTTSTGDAFWAGVHKAITNIPELPHDVRARSDAWLAERGIAASIVLPGTDVKIAAPLPFGKARE